MPGYRKSEGVESRLVGVVVTVETLPSGVKEILLVGLRGFVMPDYRVPKCVEVILAGSKKWQPMTN